jgi:hypothetical protein
MIETEAQSSRSLPRMVRAIRDLLDNPYPWDLVQIRHLVQADFGGDEEAAKAEMVTYCSAQYCEAAMARHLESKRAAAEVVRAHCPNGRDQRPGPQDA